MAEEGRRSYPSVSSITEEEWKAARQRDNVGKKLIEAYQAIEAITPKDFCIPGKQMSKEFDALVILGRAIHDVRQLLPNAFPATYNED